MTELRIDLITNEWFNTSMKIQHFGGTHFDIGGAKPFRTPIQMLTMVWWNIKYVIQRAPVGISDGTFIMCNSAIGAVFWKTITDIPN